MDENNVIIPDEYRDEIDDIDVLNYKGIFYGDDSDSKIQDEVTGAHFMYHDMCMRLHLVKREMIKKGDKKKEFNILHFQEANIYRDQEDEKEIKELPKVVNFKDFKDIKHFKDNRDFHKSNEVEAILNFNRPNESKIIIDSNNCLKSTSQNQARIPIAQYDTYANYFGGNEINNSHYSKNKVHSDSYDNKVSGINRNYQNNVIALPQKKPKNNSLSIKPGAYGRNFVMNNLPTSYSNNKEGVAVRKKSNYIQNLNLRQIQNNPNANQKRKLNNFTKIKTNNSNLKKSKFPDFNNLKANLESYSKNIGVDQFKNKRYSKLEYKRMELME